MKTISLAFLLLAVVVLAVILLRGATRTGTAVSPDGPPSRERASSPAELPVVEPPAEDPRADRGPVTPGMSELAAGYAIEPSLAEGLEVRVVHAGTREAVAGAEVHFLSEDTVERRLERIARLGRTDFRNAFRRYARRFLADDEGRVTVPDANGMLQGLAPDLWGGGHLEQGGKEPFVLELHPDPLLRVRVVNAAGEPLAGIPVTIRRGEYGTGKSPILTRAPDGIVEFEHEYGRAHSDGIDRLRVALAPLLDREVEREISLDDPPREPVELVAPSLGRLEVLVVDAEGRALDRSVSLSIRLVGRRGVDDERDPDRPGERNPVRRTLVAGQQQATLQVEIGLELEITASAPGGFGPVSERIRGPRRAGDTKTVELRLVPRWPRLVGRILEPDGTPAASTPFAIRLGTENAASRFSVEGRTSTDAAGRFRHTLQKNPSLTKISEILTMSTAGDGIAPREVRVELLDGLRAGRMDLGDLTLGPRPLLVSGTVVDEAGDPVPGARIEIARSRRDDRWDDETYWTSLGLESTSDDEGRFAIHGTAESGSLGIRARHEDHINGEYASFSPPSADVEIVLTSAGRIAGRVLYDGEERIPPIEIRITREDRPGRRLFQAGIATDGNFETDRLPPGTYTVSLELDGSREPILDVSGVVIRPGEITRDPRLAAVDLRGRIHSFRLTVVDVNGRLVAEPRASYRGAGDPEGESRNARSRNRGYLQIDTLLPSVDVEVRAPGFRDRRLVGLSSDERAVLDAGIPVRIVLADARVLPDSGYRVFVRLRPSDGRPWDSAGSAPIRSERGARLELPRPGTYHPTFLVEAAPGSSGSLLFGFPCPAEPTTIEVLDADEERVFTLTLTPEAVQRAIEELEDDG